MQGSLIRFYLGEQQRHHGVLLWEWLLEKANAIGIPGGCAFRAIGGFGRHRAVHEERFFELAGSAGVAVEFIAGDDEIEQLLALIEGNAGHEPRRLTTVLNANLRFGKIDEVFAEGVHQYLTRFLNDIGAI